MPRLASCVASLRSKKNVVHRLWLFSALTSRAQLFCFSLTGFEESNVTNEVFYFIDSRADKLEGLASCSETCKYLWDGFGQWKTRRWMPYLKVWK